MTAQTEFAAGLLSDLDSKIDALERGLHEYQVGLTAWTDGVLSKVDHQADSIDQRLQSRARELDERTAALECAIADWDRRRIEIAEHQSAIEIRERESKDLADLLAQAERDATAREKSSNARFEQREVKLSEREQTLAKGLAETEERNASIARQSADMERSREELHAAIKRSEDECAARRAEVDAACTEAEERRAQIERQAQQVSAAEDALRRIEQGLAEREQALRQRSAQCDQLLQAADQEKHRLESVRIRLEEQTRQLEAQESELAARERDLIERDRSLSEAQEACRAREGEMDDRIAILQRDRAAHEAVVLNLSRRNVELDRRAKSLSEREADLAAQQSRLEAALDNFKNDRVAVQKARAVADDVAQSRSEELTRVRAEGDALRGEIASLREGAERLERELRAAQDAAERESNNARQAQCELKTFTAQSESAKAAAFESLEAERRSELIEARSALHELRIEVDRQRQEKQRLENDLLDALEAQEKTTHSLQELQTESQRLAKTLEEERAQASVRLAEIEKREQEALALIEQAEQKRVLAAAAPDSSINEYAHIIQSANAGHAGVATFGAAFATTGSSAEGIGREAPAEVEAYVALTVIQNESPPTKYASVSAGQDPLATGSEELPPDDIAAAMKAALAAAQAEVSEAEREEAAAARLSTSRARAAAKRGKATKPSSKPSQDVARLPQPQPIVEAPKAEIKPAHYPLTELDRDTRSKVKTLKRLNPAKSEQELLAMIAADAARHDKSDAKPKRGWFNRRRGAIGDR